MDHQRWHILPESNEPHDGPAWIEIETWHPAGQWMLIISTLHIIFGEGTVIDKRPIWGWR